MTIQREKDDVAPAKVDDLSVDEPFSLSRRLLLAGGLTATGMLFGRPTVALAQDRIKPIDLTLSERDKALFVLQDSSHIQWLLEIIELYMPSDGEIPDSDKAVLGKISSHILRDLQRIEAHAETLGSILEEHVKQFAEWINVAIREFPMDAAAKDELLADLDRAGGTETFLMTSVRMAPEMNEGVSSAIKKNREETDVPRLPKDKESSIWFSAVMGMGAAAAAAINQSETVVSQLWKMKSRGLIRKW